MLLSLITFKMVKFVTLLKLLKYFILYYNDSYNRDKYKTVVQFIINIIM